MAFITFEGGEGVGKSTQILLLKEHLLRLGIPVLVTREPGGTALGEQMRRLFLDYDFGDPLSEFLVILAARRLHLLQKIKPAIESGFWVLCDRYIDSTMAYQGDISSESIEKILRWHCDAGLDFWPDITFILDADPRVCLGRKKDQNLNRFDLRDLDFHHQIRERYRVIANLFSKRCFLIPIERDAQSTSFTIQSIIFKEDIFAKLTGDQSKNKV